MHIPDCFNHFYQPNRPKLQPKEVNTHTVSLAAGLQGPPLPSPKASKQEKEGPFQYFSAVGKAPDQLLQQRLLKYTHSHLPSFMATPCYQDALAKDSM